MRGSLCLNGEWQFQPADAELTFPPSGSWDAVPIRIPSPWNVNSFSRGDGGDFHCYPSYPAAWEDVKWAWHRRSFKIPHAWRGQRLFLRFEAVHYWADVYLNGHKVGSHEGGFTPFELDVTDAVRFGAPNELIVGVRDKSYYNVHGRCPYPWGSFWGGHIRGIWQDVYLLARPPVHIADVFVRTSVAHKSISVDFTVANMTDRPCRVSLAAAVHDWKRAGSEPAEPSRPVLELQSVTLEVPAHSKLTRTVTKAWPNPHLWWPHDPHLYVLTATLRDTAGALDRTDTRFGFREFTLPPPKPTPGRAGPDQRKGAISSETADLTPPKFRLNGVTWTGRGDAWHFLGLPQMSPAFARAWYSMARRAHVNIIRLHAQVYPRYYLDVADEMGMMIVDETALWGSALNFYYNEDFLRRARQHVRELVLRDRNHPSVVIWSVANEIGYDPPGADTGAPSKDWILEQYARLAAEMRKLDPTRPVSCDGDHDLNHRLPIYSLHYPSAGKPRAQARVFTIGESGSMFYSTPSQVAYRVGEKAYRSSLDRLEAVGLEIADLIEGYRKWAAYATPFNLQWYGLQPLPLDLHFSYTRLDTPGVKPERIGPYCTTLNAGRDPNLPDYVPNPVFKNVERAFRPVRFFVDEKGCSLYGGRTRQRTLSVHNDVLHSSRLTLAWRLELDGRQVAHGTRRLIMHPGEYRKVSLALPLPAVKRPTPALWKLSLSEGDRTLYAESRALWVYPRAPVPVTLGRRCVVYDPAKRVTKLADLRGFARVSSIAQVKADELLVVGPGAGLSPEQAQALSDAVQKGLRVLVLSDNAWPSDPAQSWRLMGPAYLYAFAKIPSHPVLAGLRPSQLQQWAPHGLVGTRSFAGVPPCNLLPIITCRDAQVALAEVLLGRGRALVCALPLAERTEQEPAARVLLRNCLSYLDLAAAPDYRPAATVGRSGARWVSPSSRWGSVLKGAR
ncbi:MAG: hypothetical protein J7M26_05520, partial [Armatimonadetes bacterium]|nr:hypothetical protein [Armatimonadota bacterium]